MLTHIYLFCMMRAASVNGETLPDAMHRFIRCTSIVNEIMESSQFTSARSISIIHSKSKC